MYNFTAPMFFCSQYCAEPPGVRTHKRELALQGGDSPTLGMGGDDGTALPSSRGRARVHTHALALTRRAAIPSAGLLLLFPSGSFLIFPLSTNLTPRLKVFSGVDIIHDVTPTKSTNRAGVERRVWLDRSAVIQRSAAASASLDFVPPDHFSFR